MNQNLGNVIIQIPQEYVKRKIMSNKTMKLSVQAGKAIVLAFYKSIYERIDVSNLMMDFEFEETADGLVVLNPPTVNFTEEDLVEDLDKEEK